MYKTKGPIEHRESDNRHMRISIADIIIIILLGFKNIIVIKYADYNVSKEQIRNN